MNKKYRSTILLFYNKENNNIIGYYDHSGKLTDNIIESSKFYEIIIDVKSLLHNIYHTENYHEEKIREQLSKYNEENIGYEYVDYINSLRYLKINKLTEKHEKI
jgi:hypothetical protein